MKIKKSPECEDGIQKERQIGIHTTSRGTGLEGVGQFVAMSENARRTQYILINQASPQYFKLLFCTAFNI